jgi:hypothetical protein
MALTKATYSMIVGAPINVSDYGAIGDGTTDDTTAIEAAINASVAGVPVVGDPTKTYLVDTMEFISNGSAIYVLKDLNFKLKASVSNYTLFVKYASNVVIDNCTFDGNKANQSKHSISNVLVWGCEQVTITQSKFFSASFTGCQLFKCRNVTVNSSWFYENGKADSSYPADGLLLTVANATITNNICYMNNTVTGGDDIDGDGIQLEIAGSDDGSFWTAATDLLQTVRLQNNLCYQNGRRGIKDQRGNTEVVNNSCWGNYTQILIAQTSAISNFYYAGNALGRTGDSYINPLFYVDGGSATIISNLIFANNIGNGDITVNDAYRFQGVTSCFIFGNSYTGTVSSPYVVYGFRAPTSNIIYLQRALKDSARTDTADSTNVFKDKGFVQTLSAIPSTGTWSVGDIVYNIAPTAGQPMGWVCSVAGTPGTWLAMANLT